MNLTELNKIEEAMFAGLRGMLSGQGKFQTKVQDIFIKDFMQDAIASINNALAGGLIIDPRNAAPSASAATPSTSTSTASKSSAAVPTTSPTQVPPAQQTGQTMSPQQTATARMQTRAGIQPTGQKMTAAQRTQAQLQARKMKAAQKPKPVSESEYDKMNYVFESIINIDEQADLMPMNDYMMNWFTQYMQNVAWEGSKAVVQTQIDKLAKEYPNNLKPNLQKLAQTALALSKAASKAPAGAPQEFTQMRNANIQNVQQDFESIKAALDELSKTQPDLYNKFIKTLRPAGLAEQKKRK
jgi:hypothetical protein